MKVIAYHVTARRAHDPRGFRRCGRWFPVGEPVRVALADLTPGQAEHLKASAPRDLVVVEEFEKAAPAASKAPPEIGVIISAQAAAEPEPSKKGRGK